MRPATFSIRVDAHCFIIVVLPAFGVFALTRAAGRQWRCTMVSVLYFPPLSDISSPNTITATFAQQASMSLAEPRWLQLSCCSYCCCRCGSRVGRLALTPTLRRVPGAEGAGASALEPQARPWLGAPPDFCSRPLVPYANLDPIHHHLWLIATSALATSSTEWAHTRC